jgi:hypothetical protein
MNGANKVEVLGGFLQRNAPSISPGEVDSQSWFPPRELAVLVAAGFLGKHAGAAAVLDVGCVGGWHRGDLLSKHGLATRLWDRRRRGFGRTGEEKSRAVQVVN